MYVLSYIYCKYIDISAHFRYTVINTLFCSYFLKIFPKLHKLFVGAMQNPFQKLGQPLSSMKFQLKIKQYIKQFNQNETKVVM